MRLPLLPCVTLIVASSVLGTAKKPELPPCPSNIEFFPQNLPMHCRMTRSVIYARNAEKVTGSPEAQSFYPNSDKQPQPMPMPMPAGIPAGMPAPFPMAPMSMIPMPLPPQHKLPVVVMPFYSPDPHFKVKSKRKIISKRKKRPRHRRPSDSDSSDSDTDTDSSSDTGTDTSSDTSSDTDRSDTDTDTTDEGFWKTNRGFRRSNRRRKNRKKKGSKSKVNKNLVTPMIQYVTKDGYVIFEKQISDGEARDWLRLKHDDGINVNDNKDIGDEKDVEIDIPGDNKMMPDSHRNVEQNRLVPKDAKTPRSFAKKYHLQHKVNGAKKPEPSQ